MDEQVITKKKSVVPLAIVAAAIIVSGAIYADRRDDRREAMDTVESAENEASTITREEESATEINIHSLDEMMTITSADHIRGDLNAPVKIVEYSDFECPFCRNFHETMFRVMETYGVEGDVAWVFRHFPLEELHPVKAVQEAIASECAAEQLGDAGFWAFADSFFARTPSNNATDLAAVLPEIVYSMRLDTFAFEECLLSGRYDSLIAGSIQDATNTGAQGTPWTIVVGPDGTKYPVNGAVTYDQLAQVIDVALAQ